MQVEYQDSLQWRPCYFWLGVTTCWHPPHVELKCVIGNCFIANMGSIAETESFTMEYDEKCKNGSTQTI